MQQNLNNQLPSLITLPTQQYPNRQFKIIKKIGQGSEGEVFIAKPLNWFMNMSDVALKFQTFIKEREIQFIDSLIKYQNQESQLSQEMRSQIVKVFERTNFQGKNVLIMETGEMDLFEWLKLNKGKSSILRRVQILKEISYPIRFLHFNQMFHRDIKPENYLKIGEEFKLIDFGLVKKFNDDDKKFQSTHVGSPVFQPPEIAQGQDQYSQEVDIWSLGATFVEVLTDNQFQPNIQDYQFQTTQDVFINPQTNISLNNLLSGMLQKEPNKRISIVKVMQELQSIESQIQLSLNNKILPVKLQTKEQFNFIPNQNQTIKQQQNLPTFPIQPYNITQTFNQGFQQCNKDVFQVNNEVLKELQNLKECTKELKQQLDLNKQSNLENLQQLNTQEMSIQQIYTQNKQIFETLQRLMQQTAEYQISKQDNNSFSYLEDIKLFIKSELITQLKNNLEQNEQLIIQNQSSLFDETQKIAKQLYNAKNQFIVNLTQQFEQFSNVQKLKEWEESFQQIKNLFNQSNQNSLIEQYQNDKITEEIKQVREDLHNQLKQIIQNISTQFKIQNINQESDYLQKIDKEQKEDSQIKQAQQVNTQKSQGSKNSMKMIDSKYIQNNFQTNGKQRNKPDPKKTNINK